MKIEVANKAPSEQSVRICIQSLARSATYALGVIFCTGSAAVVHQYPADSVLAHIYQFVLGTDESITNKIVASVFHVPFFFCFVSFPPDVFRNKR